MDDLNKRGPADRLRVNVNEPHEMQYWTQKWGVSAEALRHAVQKAGPMASDVARQLGKA